MVKLDINGHLHEVDVEPDTPLLWVIREHVGMTGTKYGCGIAQCGACTVHLDGVADALLLGAGLRRSPAEITTIEGLSNGRAHPVQHAWLDDRRAAMRLLPVRPDHGGRRAAANKPKPTDADIDAAMTNICRCGTYPRIRTRCHGGPLHRRAARHSKAGRFAMTQPITNLDPAVSAAPSWSAAAATGGLSLGSTCRSAPLKRAPPTAPKSTPGW